MRLALLTILFAFIAAPAFAACTSPDGQESQTRYDFTSHKMFYCNGTNWIESGAPVGAMTNGKWCRGTGTQIVCDQDEPAGGGDNLGNHTATSNLNMGTRKITNLGAPTVNADATTKKYVDDIATAIIDLITGGGGGGGSDRECKTTLTTYNGNLGGLNGADTKCVSEFGAGWQFSRGWSGEAKAALINGPTGTVWYHRFKQPSNQRCNDWTSSAGSPQVGSVLNEDDNTQLQYCASSFPLVCCNF